MSKINKFLFLQFAGYLSIVPMIMYGTPTQYMIAIAVNFFMSSIGVSGTFHRLLAHRSYTVPKFLEYFGTIAGTLSGVGSGILWSSIHRAHHKFVDTDRDPHSPRHHGLLKVQFAIYHNISMRYSADLMRDKFHVFMHEKYWFVHMAYAAILATIDPFAIVYAYLFPIMINYVLGGFVVTLNHYYGSKDHETNDSSTNNFITGYFFWGEGWHNNHHAAPNNYKFGEKWWQLDITALVISTLIFLGIATDNKNK